MLQTAVTRNGTVMTKRTLIMSRCGAGHVLDAWKCDRGLDAIRYAMQRSVNGDQNSDLQNEGD